MKRTSLLGLFTLGMLAAAFFMPPIHQSTAYHHFANHAEHLGIPNFWNVISNIAFLLVALAAWHRHGTNSIHFRILIVGIALTAFGSAYYHAQPSDARLVWDRLPMTIVFVCIFTFTISERIDTRLARVLFWPLLSLGVASVFYWRATGDLRPYVAVQFYPLIAVPLMRCLPVNTANRRLARAQWAMIACYGLAKVAELFDSRLQGIIPAGAHAWKHILAALGLFLYTQALSANQRADSQLVSANDTPAANSSKRISHESPDLSKQ